MLSRVGFQLFNPFSSQIIAAAFYAVNFFGLWGLYATFTYIACIQLNKLRAGLLDIRQKQHTSVQDSSDETEQEGHKEQVPTSPALVRNLHKQLNDCIRHHQQILRYVEPSSTTGGSACVNYRSLNL
jgi:hypothetical protein